MLQKISFYIILVLFLLACATPAKYDTRLQSWVGKSESELLQTWGAPSARKLTLLGIFFIYSFSWVEPCNSPLNIKQPS